MKPLYILIAILLFIGIASLPVGYYTFLRIAVFIVSIIGLYKEYQGEIDFWIIGLGLFGILFNPIIPIYIHDKSAWAIIDGIAGVFFIIKAFYVKPDNTK